MPASLPVPVNAEVLSWIRAESGYPLEAVAKRLRVTPERVAAWERGERPPTLRQVQTLAGFFHRPLNLFFAPAPPRLPPLAAEYRRLPGVEPGKESPELRIVIRQMIQRRARAIELMDELGEPVPGFELQAHLTEEPASLGARVRKALAIPDSTQRAWRDQWEAWRAWRAAVEAQGILVVQFSKVELSESRGLSILHFPLPVAGVNSREQPASRIYTLMHEVIHLMLVSGQEESPALRERRDASEWKAVERFAEAAASHALVPESVLRSLVETSRSAWTLESVKDLARKFRITPLAMATRLRVSGHLTEAAFRSWKREWTRYVDQMAPRPPGFAHPVDTAIGRNGRPFVQLVLEALAVNRITAVDASRYLGLKFSHFDKLKESLQGGPLGGGSR